MIKFNTSSFYTNNNNNGMSKNYSTSSLNSTMCSGVGVDHSKQFGLTNLNNSMSIKASCFSLTPASSTTSLHNLADLSLNSLNSSINSSSSQTLNAKNSSKSKLKTKKSLKSANNSNTTLTNSENSFLTNTSQNITLPIQTPLNQNNPPINPTNIVKRKRGRPPKNQNQNQIHRNSTLITQMEPRTIINQSNLKMDGYAYIQPYIPLQNLAPDTSQVSLINSGTKMLKSLITKSLPSPNLQRKKASDINLQSEASQPKSKLIAIYENIMNTQGVQTPMPNITWAHGDMLWIKMRENELKYKHDAYYLNRHRTIDSNMRVILLDWLNEIAYAYRLHRETLHLCIEYLDRFMTQCKQEMLIDRYQLIGMTCLFIASKVEEIYPPKLKDLASHLENYSSNNEEAVSKFEMYILETLNWNISPVTSQTWLQCYLHIAASNPHVATCINLLNSNSIYTEEYLYSKQIVLSSSNLTNSFKNQSNLNTNFLLPLNIFKNQISFCENLRESAKFTPKQEQFYIKSYMKCITLLDLCMFDIDSLKFSYSVLAASAMFHMLYNSVMTEFDLIIKIVQECTGYKISDLETCIQWMHLHAEICREIITIEKMCTKKKFSTVEDDDCHNIQLYHKNLDILVSQNYLQNQIIQFIKQFTFASKYVLKNLED
jgi:hypothetical protein